MNGASADPSASTKIVPNSTRKSIMGNNQYFLRTLKNSQNSNIIENFDILILI